MKIVKAKVSFDIISGNDLQHVFKGQAFIVDEIKDLPVPRVTGKTVKDFYEEIVPKSLFINLESFVKTKEV